MQANCANTQRFFSNNAALSGMALILQFQAVQFP